MFSTSKIIINNKKKRILFLNYNYYSVVRASPVKIKNTMRIVNH